MCTVNNNVADEGRNHARTWGAPRRLRHLRLTGHPLGHDHSAAQFAAWLDEVATWLSYEVDEAVGNPVDTDDGDDDVLVLVVRTADLRVVYRGLREASATLAARRGGGAH